MEVGEGTRSSLEDDVGTSSSLEEDVGTSSFVEVGEGEGSVQVGEDTRKFINLCTRSSKEVSEGTIRAKNVNESR